VRVEAGGRPAITVFRRRKVWAAHDPPLSLLEAELRTGRTHQIRVHLTHLGHPLAGDDKYGAFDWNRALARSGLKRMFLHACRLSFVHPVSGVPVTLESPLPVELRAFLEALGEPTASATGGATHA
jgi:23S rRNA pseudouridine955/2504/2580 synthase